MLREFFCFAFGLEAWLIVRLAAAVGYPSGQRGQTVNLLAYAFDGSNPSPTTIFIPGGTSRGGRESFVPDSFLHPSMSRRCWNGFYIHRLPSVSVIMPFDRRGSLSITVRPCLVSRQDLFCCINPQKQGRWLGTRMVDERATFAAEVGSDRGANGCLNEPFQLNKVTGMSLAQRQKLEPGPADH